MIPAQKRKFGFTKKDLTAKNIKTAARSRMLALLHGMGLARRIVKRNERHEFCNDSQIRKVVVLSNSATVVEIVNYHIERASESLKEVVDLNDRSMIKRLVAGTRELTGLDVEVIIGVSNKKDEMFKRASTMTRQRGRKACKSRNKAKKLALQEDNVTITRGQGSTMVRAQDKASKLYRVIDPVTRSPRKIGSFGTPQHHYTSLYHKQLHNIRILLHRRDAQTC